MGRSYTQYQDTEISDDFLELHSTYSFISCVLNFHSSPQWKDPGQRLQKCFVTFWGYSVLQVHACLH